MEGVEESPEQVVEKRTLQLAREFGIDVANLQSLHVEGGSIEPNVRYAVDTSNHCLVVVSEGKMPGP